MRVLLTGASGFIGSHLLEQLIERGDDVRVLLLKGSNLKNIEKFKPPAADWFYGDLLDPESITKALKGCDRVYHLAGLVSTRPRDKKKIWDINYTAAINLFSACEKTKIKKIVYLASIFALGGGTRESPANEEMEYNLGDMKIPYFMAKRRAEVESYEFLRRGLPIVYVYPTFCVGPGDIFLSSGAAIVNFLKGRLPAYVKGGINVIDVRDAANALILGMEKGKVGRKYLAGDHDLEFGEYLRILGEVCGRRPPRLIIPVSVSKIAGLVMERLFKEPPVDYASALIAGCYWYYDSSRARSELGLKGRPIRETFRDAVNWFRENGYV